MKHLIGFALFSAFSVFLLTSEVPAIGVDYSGYFRTRANYDYNLDLNRSKIPEIRSFTDFRFRLDPTFYITDKIRIHGSLNFMDGVMGDSAFRGVPYSNPARSNDPYFNDAADGPVGKTIDPADMSSWVYGGATAPDAAVRTSDVVPLQVRRAWVEADFDLGTFKAGRMPYNFGLGILGNSGDDINQEIGSTRDRIVFESGLGSYYLTPGIGWLREGDIYTSADDTYEYFFMLGRKTETQHIALYLSYLAQDSARDTATNGTNLVDSETSYWIMDFFAQNKFGLIDLSAEVALFAGTYLNYDLLAVNAVGRGDLQLNKFHFLSELGFSSGTSDGDIAIGDIKTYAFNRDYNVSYIVFEEALPAARTLEGDGLAVAPHAGAISNAVYGRVNLGYDVASYFHPSLNVIMPYAPKKLAGAGGNLYGVEYDVITMWPIDEYISAEITFAHFIPGSFYDNPSLELEAQSAIMLRGGMYIKF